MKLLYKINLFVLFSCLLLSHIIQAQQPPPGYEYTFITRDDIVANAYAYLNKSWVVKQYTTCDYVGVPGWVGSTGTEHVGLPYCWGGDDTIDEFMSDLDNNKTPGDEWTTIHGKVHCSTGVDCSGFVGRCFGITAKHNTNGLGLDNDEQVSVPVHVTDVQPGDFFNHPDHVRLVVAVNFDKTIFTLIEAAGGNADRVIIRDYTLPDLIKYQARSYRFIGGQGLPLPIGFTCRDCAPDLLPICHSLNVSTDATTISINNLGIENKGNAASDNFNVDYYISATNSLSNATFIGSQTVSQLGSHSIHYVAPRNFSIPSIPANNYYVIPVVNDPDDEDMNNNSCSQYGYGPIYLGGSTTSCYDGIQNQGEFDVDCGGPCLACSSDVNLVSYSCATAVVNGEYLDLFYDISNSGSAPSGNFNVSHWVYKKDNPGTRYNLNLTSQHSSIQGNSTQSYSERIHLASALPAVGLSEGEYKPSLSIDDTQHIPESNEADNECTSNDYFEYKTLNLTFSSSCLAPTRAGEYLNVDFTLINEGSTNSGNVGIQLFVWDYRTQQNYMVGSTYMISNLAPNSTTNHSMSIHMETAMSAHGLPAGAYQFGLILDYTNLVDETLESDNSCFNPVGVNYTAGCNSPNSYLAESLSATSELSAPDYFGAPAPIPGETYTVLAPNGNLSLQAGKYIDMLPGFTAEYGSRFKATIGDCLNNINYLADTENDSVIDIQDEKELVDQSSQQALASSDADDLRISDANESSNSLDLTVNPNPFNDETSISYSLDSPSSISLRVINMNGQVVQILEDNVSKAKGEHRLIFKRKFNVPNGSYFLNLISSDQIITKKILIIN